jgi:hypothetical protein
MGRSHVISEPPQLEEPRKDVSVSSCGSKTSSGAEKKGYPLELEQQAIHLLMSVPLLGTMPN